jgi:hypothetical protein
MLMRGVGTAPQRDYEIAVRLATVTKDELEKSS